MRLGRERFSTKQYFILAKGNVTEKVLLSTDIQSFLLYLKLDLSEFVTKIAHFIYLVMGLAPNYNKYDYLLFSC